MESELPFGYRLRDKRSHSQMDLDSSASPTWSTLVSREPSLSAPHPRHSTHRLPRPNQMPADAPRRFQGDGLDFRRPVVSSAQVIDLTDEDAGPSQAPGQARRTTPRQPRPPRFGREIIDVEEEDPRRTAEPDIEFVSSRRIEPTRRRNRTPFSPANRDEDEVEFVSEAPVPETQRRRHMELPLIISMLDRPELRGRTPHLREQVEQLERRRRDLQAQRMAQAVRSFEHNRLRNARMEARIERMLADPNRSNARNRNIRVAFAAPALNFGTVGFDMGLRLDDEFAHEPAQPPPTYDAPEAAPEGFTRSPQEEEVLVCPNCEDELCIGDSDQKRQVWLVKACGHVYCGECMANRHIKKSAKGKEKQAPVHTKPFKECVVDGCQKKVSTKNAMIQVFL